MLYEDVDVDVDVDDCYFVFQSLYTKLLYNPAIPFDNIFVYPLNKLSHELTL